MINAKVLLADLTRLLKRLEDDLRERALSPGSEVPELRGQLQAEWQAARDADRTAETFESWAEQVITQAGVHWLLSCVFLRFIEDNGLVDRPWISGTPQSGRLALARDGHDAYFRAHPHQNDRDFLIASFREAGALPGLHTFFDEAHNPVFRLGISGDAAMAVMQFWQEVAADSGLLVRDFTDPVWNTRFLGDLYQDLSEATRKRYALLQTPEFVEEFILDRTLTPAIQEFGYREVRLIDPTCGSGHFLLGAFYRLVDEWARNEPGRNPAEVAQKALDAVTGIDLNPFAVAIARFRLLLAALQVSHVQLLTAARDFRILVAIGDSLLHGTRFGLTATEDMFQRAEYYKATGLCHAYATEDLEAAQRILGRQYHAVVGNPPYITASDAALNSAYREKYASCHMKFSLGVPFTERFFELAITGSGRGLAGFVGLITANSFMKREFGGKLIEEVLPLLDLTHIIDTSGVKIPGHGTPTVILFGRHRPPVSQVVRTIMGIKGEPGTPEDPSRGLVWLAIIDQIDRGGTESLYVSSVDTERELLSRHPWSIGGGGAAELKEKLSRERQQLSTFAESVGITAFTLEDEIFANPPEMYRRLRIEPELLRWMVSGDELRDWGWRPANVAIFPYDKSYRAVDLLQYKNTHIYMWNYRTSLGGNIMFGKQTKVDAGLNWWEFGRLTAHKLRLPLAIAFPLVATHNHFKVFRRAAIFNQGALVIKLKAANDDLLHVGLTGLLNSSVACFWGRQTLFPKGGFPDGKWQERLEWDATKVRTFPVANLLPTEIARHLDRKACELSELLGQEESEGALNIKNNQEIAFSNERVGEKIREIRHWVISLQEELDWECYYLYGIIDTPLTSDAPPPIEFGHRAFEISLARKEASSADNAWFKHHLSIPTTDLPKNWPNEYQELVRRRIKAMESNRELNLIERPENKRRWHSEPIGTLQQEKLRNWLLDRLEQPQYWATDVDLPPQLISVSKLADAARIDSDFMQIAGLFAGRVDFDVKLLVADLVGRDAVPFLASLRYTDSGARKRAQWEETWVLQRRADRGEQVGKIPLPPKYQSPDFQKINVWRLRGSLDVPRERWISYPCCERGADGSLPIAWAGWNQLQQAMALASYFIDMKEREGWGPERLQPLLAGLLELVPWLKQWHNEMNPDFGARMGDYYESFVNDEARALQFTLDDLRAWKPPVTATKRGRKKAA